MRLNNVLASALLLTTLGFVSTSTLATTTPAATAGQGVPSPVPLPSVPITSPDGEPWCC